MIVEQRIIFKVIMTCKPRVGKTIIRIIIKFNIPSKCQWAIKLFWMVHFVNTIVKLYYTFQISWFKCQTIE